MWMCVIVCMSLLSFDLYLSYSREWEMTVDGGPLGEERFLTVMVSLLKAWKETVDRV